MRTVSILMNGQNHAIRLLVDMGCEGVCDLDISHEGDVITERPVRPSWEPLAAVGKVDADFLLERPPLVIDAWPRAGWLALLHTSAGAKKCGVAWGF